MKRLKNITLFIIGLTAWVTISISSVMMQTLAPLGMDDYVYAIALIISVVYLQWALRSFLMPVNQLPSAQAKELRAITRTTYARGFLAGTVGFGYLFLALHLFAFLDRSVSRKPEFLSMALFLITLGTLAQARAAFAYLCKSHLHVKDEGIKTTC